MADRRFPLIETWRPSAALLAHLPTFNKAARDYTKGLTIPKNLRHRAEIDARTIAGLDSVICLEAWPHVDDMHDKWFVMWVTMSESHVLHARDWMIPFEKSLRTKPLALEPQQSVVLRAGDMILLDAHRAHWMDYMATIRPASKRWFVAVGYDAKVRPKTREKAEAFMLNKIRETVAHRAPKAA